MASMDALLTLRRGAVSGFDFCRLHDERYLDVHVILDDLAVADDGRAVQHVQSSDVPRGFRGADHRLLGGIAPALVRDPDQLDHANDGGALGMLGMYAHDPVLSCDCYGLPGNHGALHKTRPPTPASLFRFGW